MHIKISIVFVSFLALMIGCQKVALTGRKQLILVPEGEMQTMSYSQYKDFISKNKISNNVEQTAMVKRVGSKIQKAVEQYMAQKGLSKSLNGFAWEFNLVDDNTVNAWCMPGGKVVVYTGIMPLVQTETGLAVVLGHEIAHAIARHGSERMSQELIVQVGEGALSVALANKPQLTQTIFMQSFAVGAQYGVLLPYSRSHESEADHMGLIFMAMAGYNPQEATSFWTRMAAQGGQKPPEIMSTHPSDQHRIDDLKKWMPEATALYKP